MRLLIGYDGSPGADAALDELGQAGLSAQGEAIVLFVADGYLPPAPPMSDVSARTEYDQLHREVFAQVERCRVQAQRAADRLKQGFPAWTVQSEAIADSPGWGVIRWAEGWSRVPRADLVVVGATGKSALGKMLLGSVSHKVVTYARCSVRIARFAGLLDRDLQLLIGVDGSPDASSALRAVCSRNWPAGTKIRVVCVADSRMSMMHSATQGTSAADAFADVIAERAADELRGVGLTVSTHVTNGDARHELLKQAEETSAKCVFVGARGLSRIDRILLGSVSTAVAMRAACSVEVVRSPGT